MDKKPAEFIEKIWFGLPGPHSYFNFEKVSKRTHLDIASVNTAAHIISDGSTIQAAHLSAGGVGPTPLFLSRASAFLTGRTPDEASFAKAAEVAQEEITPISDARGSERYKRLLLSQLIKAHFFTLFPA
jgi:xanthine dehydrogenase small subunit